MGRQSVHPLEEARVEFERLKGRGDVQDDPGDQHVRHECDRDPCGCSVDEKEVDFFIKPVRHPRQHELVRIDGPVVAECPYGASEQQAADRCGDAAANKTADGDVVRFEAKVEFEVATDAVDKKQEEELLDDNENDEEAVVDHAWPLGCGLDVDVLELPRVVEGCDCLWRRDV